MLPAPNRTLSTNLPTGLTAAHCGWWQLHAPRTYRTALICQPAGLCSHRGEGHRSTSILAPGQSSGRCPAHDRRVDAERAPQCVAIRVSSTLWRKCCRHRYPDRILGLILSHLQTHPAPPPGRRTHPNRSSHQYRPTRPWQPGTPR